MRSFSRRRRTALVTARATVVLSAAMLLVTSWSILHAGAATNAGNATITDPSTGQASTGGNSSTQFKLTLPGSPACTGDTASGGYNVQSYMVPSNVDPASLTYDSGGPTPQSTGSGFREPLFDTSSNPYAGKATANATTSGGPGPIVNLPTFTFNVYSPGDIPAGTYNVGIACTKGAAGPSQLDNYWNAQMTVTTDAANGGPAQIDWAPVTVTTTTTTAPTTSTTAPTTSTTGATTSTTTGPTTSTTGATTSTTGATTSTTTAPTTSTTAATTSTTGATTSTTTAPTTSTTAATTSTTAASTSTTVHTTTTAATTSTTATTSNSSSSTTSTTSSGSGGATSSSSSSTTLLGAVAATDASGNVIPPGSTLTPGQQITVTGSGFTGGEQANSAANSTPIALGSETANSNGVAVAIVTIPSLAAGDHTITLTGVTSGHVVSFPFKIASTGGTAFGVTGSNTTLLLFWALLLILSGLAAVKLGRARKGGLPLQ